MTLFAPEFVESEELRKAGFKSIGENVLIAKNCTIVGMQNIEIGDNVRIDGYSTIIALSDGYVKLGSNIHIGAYSLLVGSEGIIMENFAGLSQNVRIYSRSDDYSGCYMTNPTLPGKFTNVQGGEIFLGKHVIVGTGSVLLPGVRLEEGSAVGAQSLVNRNIPAWEIHSGVPSSYLKVRKKDILKLEEEFWKEKAHD